MRVTPFVCTAGPRYCDRPPFLTIETRRDLVIVNFDDVQRTRQLYASLRRDAR